MNIFLLALSLLAIFICKNNLDNGALNDENRKFTVILLYVNIGCAIFNFLALFM